MNYNKQDPYMQRKDSLRIIIRKFNPWIANAEKY